MKRIFTLTALLVLALALNAQGYRKWDFTNWSAQTIEDLNTEAAKGQLGGSWSDIEKNTDGATTPGGGVCFWSYGSNVSEDGYLMANGHVIPETEGLVWNTTYTAKRSLALAVNYPSTSLGEYAGPQYLWLGGGNAKSASARVATFTIPKVRIGQKITMTIESHKPSDARGVSLFVNDCTNDANQIGESFKPTALATYTWEEGWTLPEGVTVEGETVDVVVYNTNGCHIYSIEVGTANEKAKVGYLYGGDIESDAAYQLIKDFEKFSIEPISATATLSADVLTAYDAIVISSTVENAEAIASLKSIQPFVPTLNLNPAIYAAWGYGTIVPSGTTFIEIKNKNHGLFRNIDLLEEEDIVGYDFTQADQYQAVTLSETGLFAKDDVLAVAMGSENVAIHAHNMSHNGYLYLPYDQATVSQGAEAAFITNALSLLADSKAKVSQAPKPTISLEYKDMNTNVTLSSTVTGAQIFYTTDGSTPTEQSTRYTEPFNISQEGITVKAVALGDGYLLSDVAEQLVELKQQAKKPTIAVESQEGKSLVTLAFDLLGAEYAIYYNYSGSKEKSQSSRYTEPFAVTKSKTIYAFVEAEGFVNSDLASKEIKVQGEKVRIDILAHMDASSATYNNGSTSTAYYFPWGKNKSGDNAYPYYNPDSRKEDTGTDPETGDEIITVTYDELNPEEAKDFENGWMLRARGQIVDWENLSTGNDIGNTGGYNYASVDDIDEDFPATKGAIVLADKNTVPADYNNFPYNAYIVTTEKFQGPFDVVINVASITKPDASAKHQFVLQTSKDGNVWESDWQTIGDTLYIEESARLTHNFVCSYNETDEVYVRAYLSGFNSKIGFYDIYIANEGEKSKERLSGITENKLDAKAVPTAVYSLNGTRLNGVRRGFNIIRNNDGSTKKVLVK